MLISWNERSNTKLGIIEISRNEYQLKQEKLRLIWDFYAQLFFTSFGWIYLIVVSLVKPVSFLN